MRRNWGIAILRIAEWSVTGAVAAGVLYLLATDQLYQWRATPAPRASEIITGSLAQPLERSRWQAEQQRCLDLVDIVTDRDLSARSADYVQGWEAARDHAIRALAHSRE